MIAELEKAVRWLEKQDTESVDGWWARQALARFRLSDTPENVQAILAQFEPPDLSDYAEEIATLDLAPETLEAMTVEQLGFELAFNWLDRVVMANEAVDDQWAIAALLRYRLPLHSLNVQRVIEACKTAEVAWDPGDRMAGTTGHRHGDTVLGKERPDSIRHPGYR
jgi:hypothetical protein